MQRSCLGRGTGRRWIGGVCLEPVRRFIGDRCNAIQATVTAAGVGSSAGMQMECGFLITPWRPRFGVMPLVLAEYKIANRYGRGHSGLGIGFQVAVEPLQSC